MKKLFVGIILALAMLIPFIDRITSDADSQQDWTLGIVIIVLVVAFAIWLVARADRSDTDAAPAPAVVSPPQVFAPTGPAAVPVCAVCGAASTGTKFCTQCGKPFQPRNACAQCGTQLQSGLKFCPECGRKVG